MLKHKLIAKGKNTKEPQEYRFCEVEFYLHDSKDIHNDTFTHPNPNQRNNAKWYFLRSSNTNLYSFKSGTYKGLNISFGLKAPTEHYDGTHIWATMLIRALINIKTGAYIEGPCNCVHELIKLEGCKEIKELKFKSWPDNDGDPFDKDNIWYLEKHDWTDNTKL